MICTALKSATHAASKSDAMFTGLTDHYSAANHLVLDRMIDKE